MLWYLEFGSFGLIFSRSWIIWSDRILHSLARWQRPFSSSLCGLLVGFESAEESLFISVVTVSRLLFSSVSPEAFEFSEQVLQTIAQHRIISNLSFNDMNGRFEAVSTAHQKTFEWIFKEYQEQGRAHSSRESFIHWLSSGTGIFHISGKMGSGKSTLMKFLCDHDRTPAELEKWAGMCICKV
jgi:hypothetical protein